MDIRDVARSGDGVVHVVHGSVAPACIHGPSEATTGIEPVYTALQADRRCGGSNVIESKGGLLPETRSVQ